jgi:hypothetical protein
MPRRHRDPIEVTVTERNSGYQVDTDYNDGSRRTSHHGDRDRALDKADKAHQRGARLTYKDETK